ncbi:MAG: GGDEF domain-containing protein [Planctomycetota bacterium]
MSAAFSPHRNGQHDDHDQPRIVVAGGGALAARVAGAAAGSATVVAVPGVLAALAEVAQQRKHHQAHHNGNTPVRDRVVLDGRCLEGIEATTLATLHELGVGDRVLLVGVPREAAVAAGWSASAAIDMDASLERWSAALETAGQIQHPEHAVDTARSEGVGEATRHSSVAEPSPLHPESLRLDLRDGDSELVQAILDIGAEGGKRAPRIALSIAQHRSGVNGLGLVVHERGEVPADHASALVAFRGETYGSLHAPTHPEQGSAQTRAELADRLQPWADWLARWIALDQQARRLRDMAMRDELTGVWNRRYFDRFLARLIDRAGGDRRQVTLMVFDIDDFKKYNDTHGHAAGDDILKAAAELMQSVVRDHDVVARIGGDEFAVIFWDAERQREEGSTHPDDVANIAKRFQAAVCDLRFPALARSDMDTLTISGGLAGFPWDGRTPAELLHHADLMAMESKRRGKNALTFGAGAIRCELPPPGNG